MARSLNAELAAVSFGTLVVEHGFDKESAWKAIAMLLLSCQVYAPYQGWIDFHDVIVYREANDFKRTRSGQPNSYLKKGESMTAWLANELGVSRTELCESIGLYWRVPQLQSVQPNNPVGHAFRTLVVEYLKMFGDQGIIYQEEVSPFNLFQGHHFTTRSKDPKIDIVAYRDHQVVALISSRWRYRHDRVDMVEEAWAYAPPARRLNPNCGLYAFVGEFAASRLLKVLDNCPPTHPNPALTACVHFCPELVTEGLGENGRLTHLKGLSWMADESFKWR
jgi:hypothetical protein